MVLNRKLLRDLHSSRRVLLTVVALSAVGSGSFVGFGSAQRILEQSQQAYYRDYRFADFWIDVKKLPLSEVERLARLPQIAALDARVVFDVILDLPSARQPLSGRLISAPRDAPQRTINGVCLVRGSGFSSKRREEVILGEAFARAHGLNPGDRIELILNRKRESFIIVGTAVSPEYVYMVRGEGDLLPDPEHFGILYIEDMYARDVLDFQDACNQVVGVLAPGRQAELEPLLERLRRRLDPFGVLAVTPRSRQASNRFLSDEIAGLAVSAVIMPGVFLIVAALALNLLMNRLTERQRTIIGTLKSLGYSDRQVLGHYLRFGVAVGLVGGVLGGVLGTALAAWLIDVYKSFYQFPRFLFEIHADLLLLGVVISVVFSVAGTYRGVRAVLRLQPAEAMRPRPAERGGAVFLERYSSLWNALSFRSHMAVRGVLRNRRRSAVGVLSAMLASAIVLTTLVLYDSMVFLVDFQFEHVAHSDVDIGMRDEQSADALAEARALPGVDYAEPLLGLTCDLRRGMYSRRLTVTGLPAGHRLITPLQADLSPVHIPPQGLVMSRKLAQLYGIRVGDLLELTPVRGRRQTVAVRLADIVDGYLGLDCYADLTFLNRVVGEVDALNAIQLAVQPHNVDALYARIKRLPNAQGVAVRDNTIANIEDTFVKTMLFSLGIMILFSGVIALGSTLNASLLEIGDRLREISTLRVMGYTAAQISGIFFRQNLAIGIAGWLLSLPFGYAMTLAMARAYDTELYRMPVVFKPQVVALTAGVYLVFLLLSQVVVYQEVRRLRWQEGIKVNE